MLVITRKSSESLYIGEDIKITILSNTASHIKIGIEAPEDILILREELTQTEDNVKPLVPEHNTTVIVKKRRRFGLFSSLLP